MPNIYTQALKLGADRLEDGLPITFIELVQHLIQNGQHPELGNPNFRKLFIVWYFQHFYSFELKEEMQYFPNTNRLQLYIDWANNGTNLDVPSYLMTDSYSQYLQYQQMEENRIAANQQLEENRIAASRAMKIATISIYVTAFLAIASIVVTFFFDK